MKKVSAIIEMASDGNYSIYMDADDMDYLVTATGATSKEAIEDFKKGYEDIKSSYERDGKHFEEVEFEVKYDMASFLSYYTQAFSLAGLSRITGINKSQLSHYATGHRKPSRTTINKIQKSVHEFANELSQVHFA